MGKAISKGELVVFPTDTVYGVGSAPLSQVGLSRCYKIKKRVTEKKLPVLFSNFNEVHRFVKFSDVASLLAREFWPGKVTLILPVKEQVDLPSDLIGEERTLGVRIPNHACCLRLIDACGGSLIGTSANLSGHPSFIDPSDPALLEFAKDADYFVRGECGTGKLSSTVLELSKEGQIIIKREGAITRERISSYLERTSNAEFSFSAETS